MKSVFKWIFGLVGAAVLAVVVALGAVYLGWIPVPDWVVGAAVSSRGLSSAEADKVSRSLNLYRVLRTAPESKLLDQALALATRDATGGDWFRFVKSAWPQLSAETKQRVREQLRIDDADFAALDKLVTARLAVATEPDSFRLTAGDEKLLLALDAKYGFTELLTKVFDTAASP
ncbi:MAG: hypothetical protein WCG80_14250 [Spirochaetales bacterium]